MGLYGLAATERINSDGILLISLIVVQISSIGIEHVSQDVLGVLESLNHFEVGRLHRTV